MVLFPCSISCRLSRLSKFEDVFPKVLSENLTHYDVETDEAISVLALAHGECMECFTDKLSVIESLLGVPFVLLLLEILEGYLRRNANL
jgi:hypothetical protein